MMALKRISILYVLMFLIIVGCNSESSSSGSDSSVPDGSAPPSTPSTPIVNTPPDSGLALPTALNVVPAQTGAELAAVDAALGFAVGFGTNSQLTDEEKAQNEIRVSLSELDELRFIDELLSALDQTQYDHPSNVGAGPYAALIRFEEDSSQKLEKWIVNSFFEFEDNRWVNYIHLWIKDHQNIKAVFKVYSSPTAANRYGEWDLVAQGRDDDGDLAFDFVVNTKPLVPQGTEIRIQMENEEYAQDSLKARMIIQDDSGDGIMEYYNENDEVINSRYAYNFNHVRIENNLGEFCHDRTDPIDLVMDYRVFDEYGAAIEKSYQFGFPVKNQIQGEDDEYYWYGSWNTHHTLWGRDEDANLPDNLILERHDYDNQEVDGREYFVKNFKQGILIEKTETEIELSEIEDILIRTWEHGGMNLIYNANISNWEQCLNYSWELGECEQRFPVQFWKLGNNEELRQHSSFYSQDHGEVSWNSVTQEFEGFVPEEGMLVWGYYSTPLYLEKRGQNWIRYEYSYENPQEDWKVTLGQEHAFSPLEDFHYWGRNDQIEFKFMLKPNGEIDVFQSFDQVIYPGLMAESINGVDLFDRNQNTFRFNPGSMNLHQPPQGDSQGFGPKVNESVHDLTTESGRRFEFRYPQSAEETWNHVTYLYDLLTGLPVFLDRPLYFEDIEVGGVTKKFVGYDGHMRGLPHYWDRLRENNWRMNDDIEEDIFNIPYGYYADRSNPNKFYAIKPRRTERFFREVGVELCSTSVENNFELILPEVTASTDIGPYPGSVELKVVEGEILE